MEEFELKNQITSLIYDLLKKKPNSFSKLNDNTVVLFFDLTNFINPLFKSSKVTFNVIELKIIREQNNNQMIYKLFAKASGNLFFDYFISDLDPKTAYKFFQTELMEQKQIENLSLVRDTLLKELNK